MVTLVEISLAMGIPKSAISWKSLGWTPIARKGNALLFPSSILEEFRLAMSPEGKLGIYWAPWDSTTTRWVLGWEYKPFRWEIPEHYKARANRYHALDNFYNPLEVKEYAESRNRPFYFLRGYKGEARERWIEQICLWEGDGQIRTYDVLDSARISDRGEPSV